MRVTLPSAICVGGAICRPCFAESGRANDRHKRATILVLDDDEGVRTQLSLAAFAIQSHLTGTRGEAFESV